MTDQIICADAIEGLRTLPDESCSMCVTSPPYYGLRDYGAQGQIGTEETPTEYIQRLVSVFREVHRLLRSNGTLWVNIADSYAGSGKGLSKNRCVSHGKQDYLLQNIPEMPKQWGEIKAKDMIGIPWMLAFALRQDGWYLRSDIIWEKINCLPESVRDRPTKSYEHIFLFAKSNRYYFDSDAIKEPTAETSLKRYQRGRSGQSKYADFAGEQLINSPNYGALMNGKTLRNKRDVWHISTNSYRMDGHFAMYPERLIEPCILAGSPVDGVVLDPFFGSGTTGAVAKRLNRHYIGIDINQGYCDKAAQRISNIDAANCERTDTKP